jgi:hypothetical protein
MVVALVLAPALAHAAGGPVQPIYREIGDWVLACDNTRSCTVKSGPDELAPGGPFDGSLVLEREAGPSGKALVRISTGGPFAPGAQLDGRNASAPWVKNKDDDGSRLEGEAALAFMRTIRNGKRLALSRDDSALVSLKGLSAVLLAMDEAQGRLGTVTALVRTGPAPATGAPGPAPMPVLHAAPPPPPLANPKAFASAVRASAGARLKAADCDVDDTADDEASPLTKGEAVVLLGCEQAAYQQSMLAFRVPRDAPANAKLLVMPKAPGEPVRSEPTGLYVGADYDPHGATFSSASKGRGLADCGLSQTWVFDGAVFQPASVHYLERCSGGEPGDWPTLYRTQVTR